MFFYPMEVGGWPTRVLQAGTGGEAVVFVHGTGGRADRWSRNLEAVAASGRRAYAIDLPGHGFAGKGAGFDYSVPGYASFLGAFLDAAKIDRCVLVGTSLGGHVVSLFTCDNPERVSRLVLCGSMGLVPIGPEARGRIQKGAVNQTYEAVRQKLGRVIYDATLITEDLVNEEHAINNSPGAAESFRQLAEYIGGRLDDDAVGERMREIPNLPPVLLVWGAQDSTVPPSAGAAANKIIPGSSLSLIDSVAHSPYLEKPAEFNSLLLEFLNLGRATGTPAAKILA